MKLSNKDLVTLARVTPLRGIVNGIAHAAKDYEHTPSEVFIAEIQFFSALLDLKQAIELLGEEELLNKLNRIDADIQLTSTKLQPN